jgi:hypothetical protein
MNRALTRNVTLKLDKIDTSKSNFLIFHNLQTPRESRSKINKSK